MVIEATETQVDEYLQAHGVSGRGSGIYTEAALVRKMREHEVDAEEIMEEVAEAFGDTLQHSEMVSLGYTANLTPKQQQAWELLTLGFGYQEIADILGLASRQVVYDRVVRARARLLSCAEMKEYYGLWEVYDELIHRICKARPCRRGGNWRKYADMIR